MEEDGESKSGVNFLGRGFLCFGEHQSVLFSQCRYNKSSTKGIPVLGEFIAQLFLIITKVPKY